MMVNFVGNAGGIFPAVLSKRAETSRCPQRGWAGTATASSSHFSWVGYSMKILSKIGMFHRCFFFLFPPP